MNFFKLENNLIEGRTIIHLMGFKFKFINKKLIHRLNYNVSLSRIFSKYNNQEKIRVGFLVSDNCKWNSEVLYELLEESNIFEPIILVTLYDTRHSKKDLTKPTISENYEFFVKKGKRVAKAYDEEKAEYINLNKFNIDILFYQQPWGVVPIQGLEEVSHYALCCYIPYGISLMDCNVEVRPFHEKLFAYFIPNETTKEILMKYKINELNNLIIVGYPKLDIYKKIKKTHITKTKKTIIYAPHHSYNRGLKIGTFNKTGLDILNFAKHHREYNWVFKPHPDLKEVLYKDKKFGKEFTEKYYKEWANIGLVYDKGDYFELFMSSDILITDCDAFLLEYMPTLNPIIRLTRNGSCKLSLIGEKVMKGIYKANNFRECEKLLKKLENPKEDTLFKNRRIITSFCISTTEYASEKIIKELEKIIKEGNKV